MIIREWHYQCDNCGWKNRKKWGPNYPETLPCPTCQGKARVKGFVDVNEARRIRRAKDAEAFHADKEGF